MYRSLPIKFPLISMVMSIAVAASVGLPLGLLSGCNGPPNPASSEFWHTGNFRLLESMSADLVSFVQGLDHPSKGEYGKLSSTRKANFNAFLEALFSAIDASLADGNAGDWCSVKSKAATAGYAIARFFDTDSGRWFVFGQDTTPFGQAYFFINPFAKRNIVIEVPHEGLEQDTGSEGARILKALAARALIINKEDRCSDPDSSPCAKFATKVCNGVIRESDVAHHTANAFYLLHVRYSDMDPQTKFIQLHGMSATAADDVAEIGDGTNVDVDADSASVSNKFAQALRSSVAAAAGAGVRGCQEAAGDPPSNLCGETNAEARYTHNPSDAECPAAASKSSKRFVHVEQQKTLRDDDNSDGWNWVVVRDALKATWPDCNMNKGDVDCSLGPRLAQPEALTCPALPTPSAGGSSPKA